MKKHLWPRSLFTGPPTRQRPQPAIGENNTRAQPDTRTQKRLNCAAKGTIASLAVVAGPVSRLDPRVKKLRPSSKRSNPKNARWKLKKKELDVPCRNPIIEKKILLKILKSLSTPGGDRNDPYVGSPPMAGALPQWPPWRVRATTQVCARGGGHPGRPL